MTTYDSVCFDLRLASVTIMNVLIVLIVTSIPVQLTIVSHIRKYDQEIVQLILALLLQ